MKHQTSRFLVVLRALSVLSACLLSFIPIQPAHAILVYSNDFEGGVGAEWSSAMTETTPVGSRGFLGRFDNATITLTLALPTHTGVTVSFDLFILQSWDGNDTEFGPDIWELMVDGGPTLVHTTFTNAFASELLFRGHHGREPIRPQFDHRHEGIGVNRVDSGLKRGGDDPRSRLAFGVVCSGMHLVHQSAYIGRKQVRLVMDVFAKIDPSGSHAGQH